MDWSKYEDEDRRVWREIVRRYKERGSLPEPDAQSSGSGTDVEQKDGGNRQNGPYEDPDFNGRKTAYDSKGRLLKPQKPKKEKTPSKPMSRNTKSKIWSTVGGIVGTALAGGVGGAIGSMIASPRFRKNAIDTYPGQVHTQPVPQRPSMNRPLSEPFDKDAEKSMSQRYMDWLEKKQVGQGRGDYEDDYKWDRDSNKWDIPQTESIRSVLTEALKAFRPKV